MKKHTSLLRPIALAVGTMLSMGAFAQAIGQPSNGQPTKPAIRDGLGNTIAVSSSGTTNPNQELARGGITLGTPETPESLQQYLITVNDQDELQRVLKSNALKQPNATAAAIRQDLNLPEPQKAPTVASPDSPIAAPVTIVDNDKITLGSMKFKIDEPSPSSVDGPSTWRIAPTETGESGLVKVFTGTWVLDTNAKTTTITNEAVTTGNINAATLEMTGNATLDSATITNNTTVGGTLGVTGNTSLSTLSTSGKATLDSAAITKNATVGGTFAVTGATTLNDTLNVTGATTLNGATAVNNTLNVTGTTTVVGTTSINSTGNAATRIGNKDAAAALTGKTVTATAGNSSLSLENGQASLQVKNTQGNTHGLVVGETSTTLSGGTKSTDLTLNDNGATFGNSATGAPVKVTGVANGTADFDAVNVRQFSSAVAGVAAAANIPGLDTNKTSSVGVGLGSYMNSQALAFGGSYRFSDKGVLRATLATGLNGGGSKTSIGVGAGWSW